ncbi:hypothetical protein RJ640_000867 [Escallonia rubra]|uniref:CCHC-type domain-containing protein n=1 Tax=Escallonia rubra TaxID=112253 RepID=A0AA88UCW8_9ASTE|nr:hypothetical protein RJ640_000867 [Escallonia rubra]
MARGRSTDHAGSKNKGRSRSQSKARKLKCYHCHKEGHYRKDCPERKGKKKDNSKTADVGVVEDNSDGADVLLITISSSDRGWILDTGCSYHMCPNRDWFATYRSFDGGRVLIGNDAACKVVGICSIQIRMHDGRVMRIMNGALVVMKGLKQNSLYLLQGSTVTGAASTTLSSDIDYDTTNLWHMCLGHMSERSMDPTTLLGWMKKLNPEINSVNGSESNPTSTTDPHSTRVFFDNKSHFVDPDPGHSFQAIRAQIFGSNDTSLNPAPMNGFAQQAESMEPDMPQSVMNGFDPSMIPVYKTLVSEFAVFDRWFASVPSSTQPNRLYVHSATSHGATSNIPLLLVMENRRRRLAAAEAFASSPSSDHHNQQTHEDAPPPRVMGSWVSSHGCREKVRARGLVRLCVKKEGEAVQGAPVP